MAKTKKVNVDYVIRTSTNKTVEQCATEQQAIARKEKIEATHNNQSPIMHIVKRRTTVTEEMLNA